MTPKEALHKLQSQPDSVKKIIVWGATILVGIGLLAWWFGSIKNTQFQFEELQERLNDIPVQINGEQ